MCQHQRPTTAWNNRGRCAEGDGGRPFLLFLLFSCCLSAGVPFILSSLTCEGWWQLSWTPLSCALAWLLVRGTRCFSHATVAYPYAAIVLLKCSALKQGECRALVCAPLKKMTKAEPLPSLFYLILGQATAGHFPGVSGINGLPKQNSCEPLRCEADTSSTVWQSSFFSCSDWNISRK